jgi:molybdopterin converting factor small subunit
MKDSQCFVGADKLTALQSMSRMMDYIARLQIGGNRPMTPEEKTTFQDAGKLYKQLYEAYNRLMADNAINIVSAQNAKLKKLDHALSDFFGKKLLQ